MADVASSVPSPSESAFAPHFVPVDDAPRATPVSAQPQKQQGFASKMVDAAERVSNELGVDTSAVDQADAQQAEEPDPLGDSELEIAPGKRVKRKEIAAQLAQYEALQKKQKDFERASHQRMQQAAEQRKQADAQLAQAQEAIQIRARLEHLMQSGADEDTILREFGKDPDKYWQSKLEKQYQDLQKTPEQRQLESLQAREHAIRQREQQIQQQDQQRQEQVRKFQENQAVEQQANHLSQSFMQTADSLGLPKTALTIQRFANLMASANQAGVNVTMEQLGSKVREMYKQETLEMLERLSDDDGFQTLPKTVQDKIRRSMLAKLGNPSATAPAAAPAMLRTKPAKMMSTAEYNNYVQQLRTKGG